MTIDQQFVEYIIKSLVGDPDAVQVERTVDEKGVLLSLTVAPDDLGRVIGKRGTTAQSLRTLLRALGTKNDARYNLKIVDVNGPLNNSEAQQDRPVAQSETPTEPEASTETNSQDDVTTTTEEKQLEIVEDTPDEEQAARDAVVSKTRKELEELDDLDI